jgi:hypothetical protein
MTVSTQSRLRTSIRAGAFILSIVETLLELRCGLLPPMAEPIGDREDEHRHRCSSDTGMNEATPFLEEIRTSGLMSEGKQGWPKGLLPRPSLSLPSGSAMGRGEPTL